MTGPDYAHTVLTLRTCLELAMDVLDGGIDLWALQRATVQELVEHGHDRGTADVLTGKVMASAALLADAIARSAAFTAGEPV